MNEPALQEVEWQDVRHEVKHVNKELADIIDQISPTKRYKLIKANYSFGDLILEEGIVNLPCSKGKLTHITDLSVNSKIKNKLQYSAIPLFLCLKNCIEVFIDTGSRIIPLNLFNPGNLLGVFESVDFMFERKSVPKWNVSAGARSIFMLPKITEISGIRRLRMHYGLPPNIKLKNLADHWEVFKGISRHSNFEQKWHAEILFFTEDWFAHKKDDAWSDFHLYLFKQGWSQAQFAIDKVGLSLSWESFVDAISSRNLKPTPYLADQVKHIMAIAAGKWPAFIPASNSQVVAPIRGLQKAFMEVYQLKNYLPTIMHAFLFNEKNNLPVYYSLFHPTLLEGSPFNKGVSTIMLDLRDIKLLLDTIKRSFQHDPRFKEHIINTTNFEYFHVETDMYQEINSSKIICVNDPRFLEDEKDFQARTFCSSSSFWRGCIKILANKQ